MSKKIANILSKTPLALRVVSLYILLWPVIGYVIPADAPEQPVVATIATNIDHEPTASMSATKRGIPRRIELPRIGLTRDVADGNHDANTQQWTLSDDKAHFATMTAQLQDIPGQTLIYGHNTSAVLEPVKNVQLHDELLVTSETGDVFVYIYSHDRFVLPTDVSVLSEQPPTPRVVLMTCEGWFSDTRRLLYFNFKEIR